MSVTPFVALGLNFLLKKNMKINNYWLKNLDKLATGIILGPLSAYTFYEYCKFHENRADNYIPDNIYLLKAFKQSFQDELYFHKEFLDEIYS